MDVKRTVVAVCRHYSRTRIPPENRGARNRRCGDCFLQKIETSSFSVAYFFHLHKGAVTLGRHADHRRLLPGRRCLRPTRISRSGAFSTWMPPLPSEHLACGSLFPLPLLNFGASPTRLPQPCSCALACVVPIRSALHLEHGRKGTPRSLVQRHYFSAI